MLTRLQADDIADRVLNWGREHDTGRLTAAVLDSGGHPIVIKRVSAYQGFDHRIPLTLR